MHDVRIPILTVLDWVMKKAKQIEGIRWILTTVMEDLEISQITLHHCHLSSMNVREDWEIGGGVACKLDARKCKTLGTDCARIRENIVVDGEEVEDVDEFYIPECYCRQGRWT